MKIRSVTWGRTKSANFQAQRAEITIDIVDGESVDQALDVARSFVDQALGDAPTNDDIERARKTLTTAEALAKIRANVQST